MTDHQQNPSGGERPERHPATEDCPEPNCNRKAGHKGDCVLDLMTTLTRSLAEQQDAGEPWVCQCSDERCEGTHRADPPKGLVGTDGLPLAAPSTEGPGDEHLGQRMAKVANDLLRNPAIVSNEDNREHLVELLRAGARALTTPGPDTPTEDCSGVGARWCPNCGQCTCEYERTRRLNGLDCPLHGPESDHPVATANTEGWAKCAGCDRPYSDPGFPDLVVPHEVWNNHLSPTGDEGGLLCPACMIAAITEQGIQCTATFQSGPLVGQTLRFGAANTEGEREPVARTLYFAIEMRLRDGSDDWHLWRWDNGGTWEHRSQAEKALREGWADIHGDRWEARVVEVLASPSPEREKPDLAWQISSGFAESCPACDDDGDPCRLCKPDDPAALSRTEGEP